jgi:dUTP pyrophosphatase
MKIDDKNNQLTKSLYTNHRSAYLDDAGIDLFVPVSVVVPANSIGFKIPLFIQCELVDVKQNKSISYNIYPRSSIIKTPLRLSYSVGVIDAGYRGSLDLIVDNISDRDFVIEKGERLTQICAPSLEPISLEIVNKLSFGSRGCNGLGSSGKNKLLNRL